MEVDGPVASTSSTTFTRPVRYEASYDPLDALSSGFVIEKGKAGSNAFKNQYASVYFSRLMALKPRVRANAERVWKDIFSRTPDVKNTKRVLDITQGSLCYVVGTLYMEMRLKPNILEELAREQYIQAPPPPPKFLSDDDEVMLEDESGRVRLVGKIIEERRLPLVTGVISAVLGVETQSGDFEVVDICFAGMAPQTSPAVSKNAAHNDQDAYVAIVSGLEMGINDAPADIRTGLLAEWLLGECGSEDDVSEARKITRVILAGNSMVQPPKNALPDTSVSMDKKPRKTYGYDSSTYSAAPTAQLDNFLSDLLESVDVDLMCGEKDPCRYSNFNRTTNPCWIEVAGRSLLGSSGQTLDDIFKYLDSHDRISMASSSLEWSHMAPTAPDTLFCYPFYDRDPFILNKSPNILFIGNQPEYQERLVISDSDESISTRVILVPKFSKTGQIVLVNCRTLMCKVVAFGQLH